MINQQVGSGVVVVRYLRRALGTRETDVVLGELCLQLCEEIRTRRESTDKERELVQNIRTTWY